MLNAIGECLDGHFRSKHIILYALGLPYKIIDILEEAPRDLIMRFGVFAVLIE